jgi:hypothetical protein
MIIISIIESYFLATYNLIIQHIKDSTHQRLNE